MPAKMVASTEVMMAEKTGISLIIVGDYGAGEVTSLKYVCILKTLMWFMLQMLQHTNQPMVASHGCQLKVHRVAMTIIASGLTLFILTSCFLLQTKVQ